MERQRKNAQPRVECLRCIGGREWSKDAGANIRRPSRSSVGSGGARGLCPQSSLTAKLVSMAIDLTPPRGTLKKLAEDGKSALDSAVADFSRCSLKACGGKCSVRLSGEGTERRLIQPAGDLLRGSGSAHCRQYLPGQGEGIDKSVMNHKGSYWLCVVVQDCDFSVILVYDFYASILCLVPQPPPELGVLIPPAIWGRLHSEPPLHVHSHKPLQCAATPIACRQVSHLQPLE